jgi:hypothetical protein
MPIEWKEVKSWLKDTTKLAIKEAEDLTVKGKLKMQIYTLTNEKDRLILNLGNLFYTEYKKNQTTTSNEKIIEIINKIQDIEEKIKQKKDELKKENR